jgi:hypothetical protein
MTTQCPSMENAGWRANIVLYGALAANVGIAIAKFVAASAP